MAKKVIRRKGAVKSGNAASETKVAEAAKASTNGAFVALYVDDTSNFHTYRAANGQPFYCSFGLTKGEDIPKTVTIELVSKNDPRWKPAMLDILKGTGDGSKTRARLQRSIDTAP